MHLVMFQSNNKQRSASSHVPIQQLTKIYSPVSWNFKISIIECPFFLLLRLRISMVILIPCVTSECKKFLLIGKGVAPSDVATNCNGYFSVSGHVAWTDRRCVFKSKVLCKQLMKYPDSKVHGANMNFAIWEWLLCLCKSSSYVQVFDFYHLLCQIGCYFVIMDCWLPLNTSLYECTLHRHQISAILKIKNIFLSACTAVRHWF